MESPSRPVNGLKSPSVAAISNDEARLVALYSPLRPKELNPESWERKTKFWITAIEEYLENGISFTMKDLQDAFTVTRRVPVCLPDILNHLLQNNSIVREKDVLDGTALMNLGAGQYISWTRWCLNKVKVLNPLSYLRESSQPLVTSDRFVDVNKLTTFSDKILNLGLLQNKLLTVEEWKNGVREELKFNQTDVELFYRYMTMSGKLLTNQIGSVDVVKMCSTSPGKNAANQITEVEKKEYEVRRTKSLLEADLEKSYEKQQQIDALLRQAVREKKKITAKHHLKSKKLVERRCEKLLNLVDNLTSLLLQIEDANSDAIVISAYESGKKAIDLILKENNLTTDRVTETMLDLQDVLEKQNDMTESISQPLLDDGDDEKLLDAELERLLIEDKLKVTADADVSLNVPSKKQSDQHDIDTEEEMMLKQLESLQLDNVEMLTSPTKKKPEKMELGEFS